MIFALYFIWRVVDIFIASVVPRFIPYLGFFSFGDFLTTFDLPRFIVSLANFDGIHYLLIAKLGYRQYEQVFFPLYPLLIRLLSPIFGNNLLLSGLFISNLSFLCGLFIFRKYLQSTIQPSNHLTIVFLLFFPASFFFGATYTEGLFFFLVALSFYFLKKKRLFFTGSCGFLAALTRIQGVLLVVPFFLEAVRVFKNKKRFWLTSLLTITPLLGLLTYMRYLLKTTGDQFYFFHSQMVFGPARSISFIPLPQVYFRYLKIFVTSQLNFQYFVSVFEFITFNFVFFILLYELYKLYKLKKPVLARLQLNLFSFANLLLPTLTGSLMSIPRFTLLSLSFFVFLGGIKNRLMIAGLLFLFLIFHVILLGFFIQGYFVS